MKNWFLFFIFNLSVTSVVAEVSSAEPVVVQSEVTASEYIPFKDVVFKVPETSLDSLKTAFSKKSLPTWSLIMASTGALYHYDEKILNSVQKQGRDLGIGNGDGTKPLFTVGPWDVRFPTDTGSTLYFLGDGITHFAISGSLLAYGAITDAPRPYNTGLQIIHGMTVSTIFNQILKRSFGRQAPNQRTVDRGEWNPFPSYQNYASHTAYYDAMPSGHVMTATLTFTVLIENYPEYEYWLRPLEITWLTLLGWEMVNNGVHWASDYPLGIAMGYLYGKAAARLGKKKPEGEEKPEKISWMVMPSMYNGTAMTNLMVSF